MLDQESEPLPDSIEVVERLIEEHREFMESTAKRQTEVDTVCKVKQPPAPAGRKPSAKKISTIRFVIKDFKLIIVLYRVNINFFKKKKLFNCMIVYLELIVF